MLARIQNFNIWVQPPTQVLNILKTKEYGLGIGVGMGGAIIL